MSPLVAFGAGVVAMGYAVVALFFARFWRRTRDGLFAAFAVAFLLLAANGALPVLLGLKVEDQSGVYLLRAFAFVIIIAAILMKNLGGRRG